LIVLADADKVGAYGNGLDAARKGMNFDHDQRR
jgi:hypothetical protein